MLHSTNCREIDGDFQFFEGTKQWIIFKKGKFIFIIRFEIPQSFYQQIIKCKSKIILLRNVQVHTFCIFKKRFITLKTIKHFRQFTRCNIKDEILFKSAVSKRVHTFKNRHKTKWFLQSWMVPQTKNNLASWLNISAEAVLKNLCALNCSLMNIYQTTIGCDHF